jgi:hypothetical protein
MVIKEEPAMAHEIDPGMTLGGSGEQRDLRLHAEPPPFLGVGRIWISLVDL